MKPFEKIKYERKSLEQKIYMQIGEIIQPLVDYYANETGGCVESIRILFTDVTELGSATKKSIIVGVDVN